MSEDDNDAWDRTILLIFGPPGALLGAVIGFRIGGLGGAMVGAILCGAATTFVGAMAALLFEVVADGIRGLGKEHLHVALVNAGIIAFLVFDLPLVGCWPLAGSN